MAKPLNFDIYRHPAVSRIGVYVLMHEGAIAGRVIVAYPDDGAGVVKLQMGAWAGPWKGLNALRGQAGGYGYDKTSAAFSDALHRAGVDAPDLSGRGMSSVGAWLESIGYQMHQVL